MRAGELGRIQYIYSNRLNLGKIRREENILWWFAPHDHFGHFGARRRAADQGERGRRLLICTQNIADVTTTHLEFANGIEAHIFVSWLHPFKEQKLVVVGDAGMAVFDDSQPWERKLTLFRHKIAWRNGLPEPARAEAEPVPLDPAEPLRTGMPALPRLCPHHGAAAHRRRRGSCGAPRPRGRGE